MAADALVERFVEAKGGLVVLVDAEFELRGAAVAGPALGFRHAAGGDTAALTGMGTTSS